MNSGDCWWNVWGRACLGGRISESSGAGTGATGIPLAGTKSTCVLGTVCPVHRGRGSHGGIRFIHSPASLSLLCIVNRDPYHFRLPPPHLPWYHQHWTSLFLPGKPIVWPGESYPPCCSCRVRDLLPKGLLEEETPARSHSCGASCSPNALFRITALQSITLPQWLNWNLVLIHISKDQI